MMYSSRDSFWAIFALWPSQQPKKWKFWKNKKKYLEIYHYTFVHHIWWSHMYSSWDIKHDRQNFFVILGYFLPFYPPNNLENENFEKMKKSPGDIIILNMSATNENHIVWFLRYGAWQTEYFPILDHFLPFTPPPPPNNPENQSFEKMKKTTGDIIIVHKCTINDKRIIYGSWDMKCTRQNFFVILGHFLTFYTPNSPKN